MPPEAIEQAARELDQFGLGAAGPPQRARTAGQRPLVHPLVHEVPGHASAVVEHLDADAASGHPRLFLHRGVGQPRGQRRGAGRVVVHHRHRQRHQPLAHHHLAAHRLEHDRIAARRHGDIVVRAVFARGGKIAATQLARCRHGQPQLAGDPGRGGLVQRGIERGIRRQHGLAAHRMVFGQGAQPAQRRFGRRQDQREAVALVELQQPGHASLSRFGRGLRVHLVAPARLFGERAQLAHAHMHHVAHRAQRLYARHSRSTVGVEHQDLVGCHRNQAVGRCMRQASIGRFGVDGMRTMRCASVVGGTSP